MKKFLMILLVFTLAFTSSAAYAANKEDYYGAWTVAGFSYTDAGTGVSATNVDATCTIEANKITISCSMNVSWSSISLGLHTIDLTLQPLSWTLKPNTDPAYQAESYEIEGTVTSVTKGGTAWALVPGLDVNDTVEVDALINAGYNKIAFSFSIVTLILDKVPGVPCAPTIGTATAGDGQATVTFTAPANNGGAAITSYTVTSTPGGFTMSDTASPITVTGLTNGTAYTFTVTATNSVGTGAASAASNSVTAAADGKGGNSGCNTGFSTLGTIALGVYLFLRKRKS